GRLLRTLTGHTRKIQAVAVTADGKQIISGSNDHTLKVWDLETGKEFFTFEGHLSHVVALAVTTDGKQVISGSSDRTIKV
ncbi:MAG TPA: hypothetical protein DCL61_08790, partial [Cyanobacteria bacterium UBA12227]|nr:hypothetical protein [Cyanobacteria bacterium UBA12227]